MADARHIRSLNKWASDRSLYNLTFGNTRLSFWSLTDEAIAELRSGIAADIRFERRLNRRNRALGQAATSTPYAIAAE